MYSSCWFLKTASGRHGEKACEVSIREIKIKHGKLKKTERFQIAPAS
jgi:hypothetical protein